MPGGDRIGTRNSAYEIGSAGADEAGDTEYLAFSDVEIHTGKGAAGRRKILDLQHRFVARSRDCREHAIHAAADHRLDDGAHRQFGGVELLHLVAVAKHDDPVGDLLDFLEAVGDVDDPNAFGLELLDLLEKKLGLRAAQRRGRLVEDKQLCVQSERLGDLNQLLVGGRESVDHAFGGNVQTQPF